MADCPSIERLNELLSFDEDGRLFWKIDRHGCRGLIIKSAGDRAGWLSSSGYWIVWADGVNLLAHRVVWALAHGKWPEGFLDHIDRDKTNNRPSNLRLANKSQNGANRAWKAGKSGYVGVAKLKGCERWGAKIRNKHIGTFKTPEEAAEAYAKAARETYGEYANV